MPGLGSIAPAGIDELEGLLLQDRAPLPLLPDIMGVGWRRSSRRNICTPIDADAADFTMIHTPTQSQPVRRLSFSTWNMERKRIGSYQRVESSSSARQQEKEACPAQPSPEQQAASVTSNNTSSPSYCDYQALFDSIMLLDGPIDPSNPDRFDTSAMMSSEHLLQEDAGPTQRSPKQQLSQTIGSSSPSHYDQQALFECSVAPLDGPVDILLVEQAQAEVVEDWDYTDEILVALPDLATTAPSDKAIDCDETRCWEHDCSGKKFSTHSNLLRHQIEKGKSRPNFKCPTCRAFFSRTTARNQHVAKKSCNRVRRYSNGRERPGPRILD